LILPNEDFLRAAEALRLHNFTVLEPTRGSSHYLDGLEHYAAQYSYPPEVTERHGSEVTIALFPASFVGWKLVYVPVPDPRQWGCFTTSLVVQKLPLTAEAEVDQSFVQLSISSSTPDIQDTISLTSDDTASTISNGLEESDDEYVMIRSPTSTPSVALQEAIPMERGNGPKSPTESICDIVDMKPEPGTGAIEMIPGQKMFERFDGQLITIEKGIYVPRSEALKETFKNAGDFLRRDNAGGSQFAKVLEGWNRLVV
jgi:hypothetical protein